jgi:hypothetical protein
MATIDNNLRVPDELWKETARLAARQGRSADDLAADALKRYIAHEKLDELTGVGLQCTREMGLDKLSDEERDEYIERAIRETRQERQR